MFSLIYDWKKLLCSDWLRTGKFMVFFFFFCSEKNFNTWHLQVSQLWILMKEWSYGSSKKTSNLCRIYTALNVRFFFSIMQFQKMSYSPKRRAWNFVAHRGFLRAKHLKKKYEAQLEFPERYGYVFELHFIWARRFNVILREFSKLTSKVNP